MCSPPMKWSVYGNSVRRVSNDRRAHSRYRRIQHLRARGGLRMIALAYLGLVVGVTLIVTGVVLSFLPPRDNDKDDQ